ncbi:MAG: ComF family protein [Bacteroidales bacterium]|nr:ComF family protein [Bacteroidales bacterium]
MRLSIGVLQKLLICHRKYTAPNYFCTMLGQLFSLFFPRLCAVCHKSLISVEKLLCLGCISDLPRSGYWLREENIVANLFCESPEIRAQHASSLLYYTKESPYHQLLIRLKYKGETQIGIELGQWFGAELIKAPLYQTIEAIVPVPLHPKKERKRGYNQSQLFAQGIALSTGWTLETTVLRRNRHTATQTKLNRDERRQNVAGAFCLSNPERIAGKHILLVDDVLTTGATLQTCVAELLKVPGCKIWVGTIAYVE